MDITPLSQPIESPTGEKLAVKPRSVAREAWQRISRRKVSLVCIGVVALYVIIGLAGFTPLLYSHIGDVVGSSYQPPQVSPPSLWLGADIQGRSVLWRLLYGARTAMILTVCASTITIILGTLFGVVAGYFGGWIDDFIIWLFSTVSSIPWILLVIALTFVLKMNAPIYNIIGDLGCVIVALGLTDWVGLCRLIRGEVIKLRDRDYIVAAHAIGMGNTRIIARHIIPNVFHIIIITFSLGAVGYVQAEVALSFLGLGISQRPSWGRMIDDAKLELLRGVWWQLAAASVAIFLLCLALNLLGDRLRDALDPRLRGTD